MQISRRPHIHCAVLILVLACAVPADAREKEVSHEEAAMLFRGWYAGFSAEEIRDDLKHTAPPVTIELDAKTRLTVPGHLETQEIVAIQRANLGKGMEGSIVVGLHAFAKDMPPQAYALIYTPKDEGMALAAEIPMRQYFVRMTVAHISGGESLLVLEGHSGVHFTDIYIYRFAEGEPVLLFANGSAAGAEFCYDYRTPIPTVRIGLEDWSDPNWTFAESDPRWNVYTWTGRGFAYNEALSSAREMGVEERISLYTMRIFKNVEEIEKKEALSKAAGEE